MTRRSLFPFVLLVLPLYSHAQILSTTIDARDWGIEDPASIRIIQVSRVHSPRGEYLNVQAIYSQGYFTRSMQALTPDSCLIAADFQHVDVNRLGGTVAVFQAGSSTASVSPGSNFADLPTLQVQYVKTDKGYCGLWMHLYNSAAPEDERQYVNGTRFSELRVRVRGSSGGERIIVKIADKSWDAKQDALPIGDLAAFLPAGNIDTTWQTAHIPMTAIPNRLDLRQLATLSFEAVQGTGNLEFSEITFCAGKSAESLPPVKIQLSDNPSYERALWVWNTQGLLKDGSATDSLRTFVNEHAINHVFLALPYDPTHPDAPRGVPVDEIPMKRLVRSLNASGLKVHALVGDKDFVRPDKRDFVRTTMANILRYQRGAAPAEQFFGIHLDIEPYLLPGFSSNRQQRFLEDFLDVLAECASMAREARLTIGADIPAWLDTPNELTHTFMNVARNAITKPLYQHIIDIMDFVVLMDYRTATDEIVNQSLAELRYADMTGKKVFVGLETIPLMDETLFVIRGAPRQGLPVGVQSPIIGIVPVGSDVAVALITEETNERIAHFIATTRGVLEQFRWWPVIRTTFVSASRLTFAERGIKTLRNEIKKTEISFRDVPSFGGVAVHDYLGYKALLRR